MKKLILQGAVKLLEENVVLRVRKTDKTFIEKILNAVAIEYNEYLKKETRDDFTVKFEFDSTFLENEQYFFLFFVKSIILLQKEFNFIDYFSGGVILMNQNKKIRCINDLQSRLDLVFEQECPEIKKMLFSEKNQIIYQMIKLRII